MQFRQISLAALASTLFLLPQISLAQRDTSPADHALDRELIERDLAFVAAPVKSAEELLTFIANNRYEHTPLQKLSPAARARFFQSLTFGQNGLSGFDYADLVTHLSAADIYSTLALFGAQRSVGAIPGISTLAGAERVVALGLEPSPVFVDYPDKVCSAKASCTSWGGGVCIGNNC